MLGALDSVYLVYMSAFAAAVFVAEAVYLLVASPRSYRKTVNHRLRMMSGALDREAILLQLRRERGLDQSGNFLLPVSALNRLIMQSGVKFGIGRMLAYSLILLLGSLIGAYVMIEELLPAVIIALPVSVILPLLVLVFLRARRLRAFGDQFPDAIDVIVRSLRAGHPVPVAVTMVSREMPDPIGTEFGIVADEITYGADLESAMRSLQFRVGHPDLHLFVTSISIQTSTGGNLREILQNLASVIRNRIKMRRKIKSVSSEGRSSAMILCALPPLFFALMQLLAPHFYRAVWHSHIVHWGLGFAGIWMVFGVLIMYRMTKFKI